MSVPLCDPRLAEEQAHELGADEKAVADCGRGEEIPMSHDHFGEVADSLDAATWDGDDRGRAE